MSRSRVVIGLAVGVALIAAGIWLFTNRDAEQRTALVERGSLDVTVQTVGTIQATRATTIRSSQAGVIAELGVEADDEVTEGDIVVLFDIAPFDRAVEDAQRNLEQAEFALQAAEQQAEADADNTALRLAVLDAAARVKQARTVVSDATTARRDAIMASPRDGRVIEVLVRAGDAIGPNQPLVRIAAPADLAMIANVDELDLPNLQIGAESRFRLDAFPATELAGRVVSTAPQARQQGGATVFQTEIEFDTPEGLDIRPGMNADVTIVTAEREDVLLIPEAALRTVGERSFVVVETDDGSEEREVELGFRGNGKVEIVSGLSEGERVVLR